MFDEWCIKCGGPITRSQEYAPAQPDDSRLCAPCWYNEQHTDAPLLTTSDLDDLMDSNEWGEYPIGKLVDWHSDIVPLVKCADGCIRAKIHMQCRACGATSKPFYASSGLHHGAWCYIFDAHGNYLANIRDQEWTCAEHTK